MNKKINIAVLIPCFNEEITIGKVIDDFKKELPDAIIYVFDNNSTDNTAKVAMGKNVIVIKEKKQGKGHVMVSMFRQVEADLYVLVDGDDTYPAESIHLLLKPVIEDKADMSVGIRLSKASTGSFKPLNLFGNRLVLSLVNRLFNSQLQDIMSGFRVFNREFVKNIPLISKGFEVETQLTIQSLYYQFDIEEVDIVLRERPEGSVSKLNTIKDGILVLLSIINILKAYRPMLFFSLLSFSFIILGLGLGSIPVSEFMSTGFITRFPTAIFATGLVLISIILFAVGIILDTINFRMKEIMQIQRKNNTIA
jgi:glycosyltransferase involved in cell wall biosynthesis